MSEDTRSAFERFYNEHYPMAYGYLNRMIRNADDAYDVLIHSFELALARFDEYRSAPDARYWFFGIVRNSASYFLRRSAKEYARKNQAPTRATQTPEEILLQNEEESLRNRVFNALPEKYREVALLRFQNFSHQEIAAALNLSVAAVESRMRRAIHKLEPLYAEFKEGRI